MTQRIEMGIDPEFSLFALERRILDFQQHDDAVMRPGGIVGLLGLRIDLPQERRIDMRIGERLIDLTVIRLFVPEPGVGTVEVIPAIPLLPHQHVQVFIERGPQVVDLVGGVVSIPGTAAAVRFVLPLRACLCENQFDLGPGERGGQVLPIPVGQPRKERLTHERPQPDQSPAFLAFGRLNPQNLGGT